MTSDLESLVAISCRPLTLLISVLWVAFTPDLCAPCGGGRVLTFDVSLCMMTSSSGSAIHRLEQLLCFSHSTREIVMLT
jgi:hypothetical protein